MTLVRIAALFWAVTAFACGASVDEAAPPEPRAAPKFVSFNLLKADVDMVLKALAEVTEKPLVIEPDAAALVGCASPVDVRHEGKVTTQAAVKLVAEAVRPSGLVVVEEPTSLVVKKAPGAACPS
ncbi:hypothetical protein [Sorangium sp. So ce1099]|uniref:hypothetical protein n=1 Tax=Sorangium sp. So ce1099 TaxID=3133331 RepID=UPI003F644C89